MLADSLENAVRPPSEDSIAALSEAIDLLRKNPQIKVRVVGFTDDEECSGDNACLNLSRQRAKLVSEWLQAHGALSGQLLSVEARGQNHPIDSNELESGRQRNRHVEICNTQFDP